jgi:prepilin-type processing-associated H-X9-DG protein
MKQLGLGIMQYTQDYDENYPCGQYTINLVPSGTYAMRWRMMVYPYIKSTDTYRCPSNINKGIDTGGATLGFPDLPRHYALNVRFVNNGTPIVTNRIDTPATRIMLAENAAGDYRTMYGNWGSTGNELQMQWNAYNCGTGAPQNGQICFPGHTGFMTLLWADGHAKAMRPADTAAPTNLWGAMNDSPGTCTTDNYAQLNCTTKSNYAVTSMQYLQQAYDQ